MSAADSLYLKKDGTLYRLKLRNNTVTYAKDTDRCILGNTDNNYWFANADGSITFEGISLLYDFPYEIIPVEEKETAINAPQTSTSDKDEYFTLGGIRSSSPRKGINIIRRNDGTVVKFLSF